MFGQPAADYPADSSIDPLAMKAAPGQIRGGRSSVGVDAEEARAARPGRRRVFGSGAPTGTSP